MDKRYIWQLVGLLIIVVAIILRLFGFSNRWFCEDGVWEKMGNPETTKPTGVCSDTWSLANDLMALSALLGKQVPESPLPVPVDSTSTTTPATSTATSTPEPAKSPVMVELTAPALDGLITSPYRVRGRAHGSWFFEATLPVVLTDADGRVLVRTYGTAVGDWMVDGWVDFTSDLVFDPGQSTHGYLIIKKDNPSGLPEYDAQVSYPVRLVK